MTGALGGKQQPPDSSFDIAQDNLRGFLLHGCMQDPAVMQPWVRFKSNGWNLLR